MKAILLMITVLNFGAVYINVHNFIINVHANNSFALVNLGYMAICLTIGTLALKRMRQF